MESKTTNTIALSQGASARIQPGAISTTIIPALRAISVTASVILAPVAYLQCAAGTPSLSVILGASASLLAAAFLRPSSTASRKGGDR
ncbi:MAG: hypothetical protein K1V88_06025 [Muribaculaceae bacterium]|jgi:hypothetical protein